MSKAQFADPASLLPNPWNTNILTPEGERKLDNSVRRLGCFKPVLVREIADGLEIIGGEHRSESAVRCGLVKIPITNLGPIDDKTAKEISLADNARYGADDTIALAELIKSLGDIHDIQEFLPWSDADITSIFTASTIDLDELELDEEFDTLNGKKPEEPEIPAIKIPKTHTIMRFKVSIGDAERLTERLTRIKTTHGFTKSDDLTNAGDALCHALLTTSEPEFE